MKVKLRGITYHVEQSGSGIPLLLLHGFTGTMETWRFMEPAFSSHFRLILVDIIGHGQTEKPHDANRYTITEAAADLRQLLRFMEVDRVYLLGYSMGGRLALSFSCLYPECVAGLILESASPGLKTDDERRARRKRDQALAAKIRKNGVPAFISYWEKIPLFRSQERLPESVRTALHRQRLGNSETGLACSLIGMGTGTQPSWWPHLPTLQWPVSLITGELDEKFCTIASDMLNRIPNAKWHAVPNAGHTVHLEQPAAFAELVFKFLGRHSTGDS